jgi:hypothetical protein
MDRNGIKRWQAKKIHEAVYPSLNYLLRLRERMEKKVFLRAIRTISTCAARKDTRYWALLVRMQPLRPSPRRALTSIAVRSMMSRACAAERPLRMA